MKLPEKPELQACKYCGNKLTPSNIQRYPKKKLTERHGICWGGIEYPYIQIFKITCPNSACKKKYTFKYKGSTWLYK